jgi:hypothetical protein
MSVTIPLKNTWSWLVTDLDSHGVTLLNRLATNVAITYTLNAPAMMTCDVPSDNPEINIPRGDGDTIALDLLLNALTAVTHLNPTNPSYIDYLSGHYDTTDVIDINFAQGISVGEAWTQLIDTGSLDIVLTPIYDPSVRPGKLCTLNIYSLAGSVRNGAIFAWDKFPRSLVGISRLLDGTQMANVGQYYLGGSVVTPQATDAPSIAQYGQYWLQRSFPKPADNNSVALISATQIHLLRKGKRTITIDPAPERSPDPFTDYYLGDQVMVYAGRTTIGGGVSYRQALNAGSVSGGIWTNPQRIYEIPISLADNQVETVQQLLLTDTNAP